MAHSSSLFVCVSISIGIALPLVSVNCENITNSSNENLGNVSPTTNDYNTTLSTPRKEYTNKNEFRRLYIWSLVILITILVVLFIWYAYEMTQDCVKDQEEEQDRSLYLPLYSEEEEERDINLGDSVFHSNIPSNVQSSRSELSKIEDQKNWPDLKVTNGSAKRTVQK